MNVVRQHASPFRGLARLTGVVLILLSCHPENGESEHAMKAMAQDLVGLKPLAAARVVDHQEFSKEGLSFVADKYSAEVSWPKLQQHYDAEFASKGWRALRTDGIQDWSGASGGKVRIYCKHPYTAELQYSGARQPWTFAVTLKWNSDSERPCQ